MSTLANGGSPSDIGASANSAANLVFNGGTLQNLNPGATTIDRLFTLGTSGGTIDDEGGAGLTFNNTGSIVMSGAGARTLVLNGNTTDELDASLSDNSGATGITKLGASGTWTLGANNAISGPISIAGTLNVGNGGATGSVGSGNITLVGGGSLVFNSLGNVTCGTVSGNGSVTLNNTGKVILPGNNTYAGATFINAGTLQVGNGGATGSLNTGQNITDNSLLIFNTTSTVTYQGNGFIAGSGNVIVTNGANVLIIGNNSYTGWTLIGTNSLLEPSQGNTGTFTSSTVTNNGTFKLVAQDAARFTYGGPIVGPGKVFIGANNNNAGSMILSGQNTYSGGTYIGDNEIVFGNNTAGMGNLFVGNVTFTNNFDTLDDNARTLTFDNADNITNTGNIVTNFTSAQNNRGIVHIEGSGNVTLTGNGTWASGTTIDTAILQVGIGGTNGSIGGGNVTDNGELAFNRSDSVTFGAVISGAGALVQLGAGTLTLNNANNTYTGVTVVSNGVLRVIGTNAATTTVVHNTGTLAGTGTFNGGPVTLDAPGTMLAPGAATSVGVLTINSDLNFGGNLAFKLNKNVTASNDLVVVSGALNNTGTGTLTVTNVGLNTQVMPGDKFTLFSQAVSGGASLAVTGAGSTWSNNLATDGSIIALTTGKLVVNTNRPAMQVSVSPNTLSLAWPTNLGWTLQTNSVGLTATNQWFTYPGSATVTNVSIPASPTATNVFFRLVYTNTP